MSKQNSLSNRRMLGSRIFHSGTALGYGVFDGILGSIPPLHYDVNNPSRWIGPLGWIVFLVIPMIFANIACTHVYCSYSGRGLRSADRISLKVVRKRGILDRAGEGALWFLLADYTSYAFQTRHLAKFYDYWRTAFGLPFVGESAYGIPVAYVILLWVFICYQSGRFLTGPRFRTA